MDHLLPGYRHFRASLWPERQALFQKLAERGQQPRTMVIACSDSRVDPAMVFGTGPGEMFVVRNVANLVPPYSPDRANHGTSAALEFGVRSLQVQDLIVMGHAMCGGVRFLLEGGDDTTDFVGQWMGMAKAARTRVLACTPTDPQSALEQETVRLSLENLLSFPWIAERVAAGQLHLHGAIFDIRTGILERLQPDGNFVPA